MTDQNPDDSVRLFFALWPAERERAALAAWQTVLGNLCGGMSMRPANLHATLVFLGGVAQHRLEAIKLAAQEVRGSQFDLTFDLARYWGHNHIVHAAPSVVPPQLQQLAHDLERSLSRHRFRFDRRQDYKPHVTLLRHAKWTDAPLPVMPEVTWLAKSFMLVQSVGSSDGVGYKVLEEFSLH
jgi:2'-5' RNA ligase